MKLKEKWGCLQPVHSTGRTLSGRPCAVLAGSGSSTSSGRSLQHFKQQRQIYVSKLRRKRCWRWSRIWLAPQALVARRVPCSHRRQQGGTIAFPGGTHTAHLQVGLDIGSIEGVLAPRVCLDQLHGTRWARQGGEGGSACPRPAMQGRAGQGRAGREAAVCTPAAQLTERVAGSLKSSLSVRNTPRPTATPW